MRKAAPMLIVALAAVSYRAAQELDWAPKDVVFFPLLVLAVWLLILVWAFSSHQLLEFCRCNLPGKRGLMVALLVGAIIGAVTGVAWWALFNAHKERMSKLEARENLERTENSQSLAPAPPTQDPIIGVSYEMKLMGLPILIEPFGLLPLILIREDRTVNLATFKNDKDTRFQWPTDERIAPPEPIGILTISNYGDVAIFDVSYLIKISVGTKDAPLDLPLTLPPFELQPGKSQKYTIVNQSSLTALVRCSTEAGVQVQGQAQRRKVPVQSRDITLFDRVPMLTPSWHKWSGLKMNEPDMWKKNKATDHGTK